MTLRRGFKSEANELALYVRRDLGLPLDAPLDPLVLAAHFEIPVMTWYDLFTESGASLGFPPEGFSAVTIFSGCRRLIVHNDQHAPSRQRSNIAHEFAHSLLFHDPIPPFDANGGHVRYRAVEEEANWLGPALLVSEEAALSVAKAGLSVREASDLYAVSPEVMRMRIGVVGARRRVGRKF